MTNQSERDAESEIEASLRHQLNVAIRPIDPDAIARQAAAAGPGRFRGSMLAIATALIAGALTLSAITFLRPSEPPGVVETTLSPSAQPTGTPLPTPSPMASCHMPSSPTSATPAEGGTIVDESGILLVPIDEQVQATHPCEEFLQAFDQVLRLAMAHPSDFGYPWIDLATNEVVFSVVTSDGRNFAAEAKATLEVPYRIREVDWTYAQLQQIQHDVTFLLSEGVSDAELIFMVMPDQRDNRTLVVMSELSRPLLEELANRFGADAIAVRVDPNPPPAGY